jgi:DNA-binding FrmR family transcriptional regulator
MAGIFKGRLKTQQDFERCADLLDQISAVEKAAFTQLSKIKFK